MSPHLYLLSKSCPQKKIQNIGGAAEERGLGGRVAQKCYVNDGNRRAYTLCSGSLLNVEKPGVLEAQASPPGSLGGVP